MSAEVWKPAPEPGYEVSNLGRIRSWRSQFGRPYVMTPSPTGRLGHLAVSVSVGGRTQGRLVHRWVLEAFVGPCPEGMECRHLDGNPGNNRLDNLCWGTRIENAADCARHGTDPRGERNPRSKLTWATVREIRRCAASGATQPELARRFGVARETISQVVTHRTWREQP